MQATVYPRYTRVERVLVFLYLLLIEWPLRIIPRFVTIVREEIRRTAA